MIKCPKCGNEMKDGAKFCSECATPLPGSAIEIETTPKTEESAVPAVVAPEVVAAEEVPAPPATQKRRSIKGLFLSLLLAIVAVVAMYVFYEDLGFVTPKTKAANVVLYVKDGQLYYNDLDAAKEYQITKDLESTGKSHVDIMLSVRLSADGKTVFYPDRTGGEDDSYALYCATPGGDALPIKLGSDVILYSISDKGDLVYYITTDGSLYRHDLTAKNKIDNKASAVTVAKDGKEVVYLCENGLYYIEGDANPKRISADVSRYDAAKNLDYVYFSKEDGYYCFDKKEMYQIASKNATLHSGWTNGCLVFEDEDTFYLAKGKEKYALDCAENAQRFLFSQSGEALYYLEGNDAYCVKIKNGKPGAATLCESDVGDMLGVVENSLVCLKDMKDASMGDLYIGGKCVGADVSLITIAFNKDKQLAYLADCTDGSGTLVVYENKPKNLGTVEARDLAYTEKGELLVHTIQSGKGELYRLLDGKLTWLADDVSWIVTPIEIL